MFEALTKKNKYSSPEINVITLSDTDVITTSSGQGGTDGSGGGDNLDHSGWT